MLKPFWLSYSGMFTIKFILGEATTESVSMKPIVI